MHTALNSAFITDRAGVQPIGHIAQARGHGL